MVTFYIEFKFSKILLSVLSENNLFKLYVFKKVKCCFFPVKTNTTANIYLTEPYL